MFIVIMANKMLSELQFALVPTKWEGGRVGKIERGGKEGVSEIVSRDLFAELFPLMCDEWLCGRCEIGSIKKKTFQQWSVATV